MIFSSYKFIFIFLPIVFIGYSILQKLGKVKALKLWLSVASLYFYAQGSPTFFPFFVGTIVFNYSIGKGLHHFKNNKLITKFLLVFGLIENIGLLGYFKYTNFFLENMNRFTGTSYQFQNIILPIGISFFTFQLIAYIVDVYRGKVETKYSFLDYFVFITFFPQLIVGPIVHHKTMVTQLDDSKTFCFDGSNIAKGIFVFSIGCAKKILIADPLIALAKAYYGNLVIGGFFESWFAVLAFTFAYYFDFSGYGDMAVGLGYLFNIKLPFNFDSPYKAKDFNDYWKRWNITLSNFLNDYVFKSIYKFGDRAGKLFLAVMVTFLVSGVWHGAGWHFIVWGIVNGIFVCMSHYMILKNKNLPCAVSWLLTFIGILITRVLFDSQNTDQAIRIFKVLGDLRPMLNQPRAFFAQGISYMQSHVFEAVVLFIGAGISFFGKSSKDITKDFRLDWKTAAFAAALLTMSLFRMGQVSDFLYFQF